MNTVDKAVETQLNNIQKKTGKSLAELAAYIQASGLTKHWEIRSMLMRDLDLGYGDANTLVHYALKSDGERAAQEKGLSTGNLLDEIYAGTKANLRPIHDRLMESINTFGEFEIASKKGYVSLRRKKQFVMIGPATNTRVEVGINIKQLDPDNRLIPMPAGSMCNYKVKVSGVQEIDDNLIAWIRAAYNNAG
jgi:hypothetical protein